MSAMISADNGAGSTTPLLVLKPVRPAHRSRNVVHELIDGGIAVSLVAPDPRAGDMQLLYPDEAAADAAIRLHTSATSFTLSWPERPTLEMVYVLAPGGELATEPDPGGTTKWLVTIAYQEVGGSAVRRS